MRTVAASADGVQDKPPPVQLGLFGPEHVLIMFVAMVTPALTIGQLLDLPQEIRVTLVSSCTPVPASACCCCRWRWIRRATRPIGDGNVVAFIVPIVAITSIQSGCCDLDDGDLRADSVCLSPVYAKLRRSSDQR